MRVHSFLFGTTVVLVAAAAVVQACGGDTSSATTPADAGNDATVDAAKDNSQPPVDAGQDTNTCDPNADFIKKIPGDADIGDGESSLGLCASCVESKCHAEVTACNKDCKCQGVADKVLVCVAMSGGDQTKLIQCALSMGVGAGALSTTSEALVACVQADCPVACPVPDAGLDASND
ncbi:MAG TPA: hypothetical protein VIF62_23445 [Labilithrix sp.]|jgi:hypothetical protein